MKTVGLGIALVAFGILFQLCTTGLGLVSLVIGGAGLIIAMIGATSGRD